MATLKKQRKTTIDDLPQEITENILQRLPIKVLGSCMCVKKHWLSLIKNKTFVAANTNNKCTKKQYSILWHPEGGFLMYADERDSFEFNRYVSLSLNSDVYQDDATIASYDGLICVDRHRCDDGLVLMNPIIKKTLRLPQPPPMAPRTDACICCPKPFLGLAFDSSTMDHKLVRIQQLKDNSLVHIYSLQTNSWKMVSEMAPRYDFKGPGVPISNGVVHWFNLNKFRPVNSRMSIVGFNVNTEEFKEIEFPEGLAHESLKHLVGYLQSSIAICCEDFRRVQLEVWVMKEYDNVESWSKIWAFNPTILLPAWVEDANLYGLRSRGELLWNVTWDEYDKPDIRSLTISTDPESGENKYLPPTNVSLEVYYTGKLIRYFEESLILLDNENAVSIPADEN